MGVVVSYPPYLTLSAEEVGDRVLEIPLLVPGMQGDREGGGILPSNVYNGSVEHTTF